jgi:Transglycosylase SLT domain
MQMAAPTATLSWEKAVDDGQVAQQPHPERNAWSLFLCDQVSNGYNAFIGAQDITLVIPNFSQLNRDQRVTKLAELFVRVAEYEASWDPNCTSVDVNGQNDPDHLATGLYQLNVSDQVGFHTGTNFTAAQLKDPLNNITCGVNIVLYLISRFSRITFTKGQKGIFFETLLFDAKYPTVDKILKDVWSFQV